MKDLAIKAVVTSPSGFYYREEHEWRGLDAAAAKWFEDAEAKMADHITKAQHGKKGGGDLTAYLDSTRDGVADPQMVIAGFGKQEMREFQKMFHKMSADIVGK